MVQDYRCIFDNIFLDYENNTLWKAKIRLENNFTPGR